MLPLLTINLDKLQHNTEEIVDLCRTASVEVCGVTKGVLGSTEVARAMLAGGVKSIGDSRLTSLRRPKKDKISSNLFMLRQPMKAEIKEAVSVAGTILLSDFKAAEALAYEARKKSKTIGVVLMVETGDLREGIIPNELREFTRKILALRGVKLKGLATNATCLRKNVPTLKSLLLLCSQAYDLEKFFGIKLAFVSGGNSSALQLVEKRKLPDRINQLRIGEAILLGHKTPYSAPIKGTYQNCFVLSAEVLQVRKRPSSLEKGFKKKKAHFQRQAVVALGKQDVAEAKLKPLFEGVEVARSSDHLVLDLSEKGKVFKSGEVVNFIPSYFALLQAMTSPFVKKKFIGASDKGVK